MRLTLRVVSTLACVALAVGCTKSDPNKAETWFEDLQSEDAKVQLNALDHLREIGDKAAVPKITPLLKQDGKVKVEAASALAKLGDPAAVPALIDALDLKVGAGADEATKNANKANKEIAEALGALGDKSAVDPLIKLVQNSKDAYAKVAAINALGALGDSKAVKVLSQVATSDAEETYVNKKAIQALGNIGDPAAVPAIKKMLFHEREGKSFYAESSYAAYQIGKAAAAPLLTVLEGKDEALEKWADEHDIYKEALYAKAAQVLGDLNERKAIPTLIKLLSYSRPGSEDVIDPTVLIVRRQAAQVLGRMRAEEAVPSLVKGLKEIEGNVRAVYAEALVSIGDEKALPYLEACALEGNVMDKSAHARKGCYIALSQIGNHDTLEQWHKWQKAEPGLSSKACMNGLSYDSKSKAKAQKHCDEMAANIVKILAENESRLVAADQCKHDAKCWIGKLKDKDAKVRQRAAVELGRMGDSAAIGPLMAALEDNDLEARHAAILAVDWIASGSKEALASAKKGLDKLDAQIEDEKGKVHFVKVNQDLKRLAVKIRRLDRIGS